MRKFTFLLCGIVMSFLLHAGVVEKSYTFEDHKIVQNGDYFLIQFEETILSGITGEPILPYASVRLILPPGEEAVSIEFIGEEEVTIPGNYTIYPRQASRPLSEQGQFQFVENEEVYNKNINYPEQQTGKLANSYLNGYAIALTTFTPVMYNPLTGTISYYKSVKIKITTEPSIKSANAIMLFRAGSVVLFKIRNWQSFIQMKVKILMTINC